MVSYTIGNDGQLRLKEVFDSLRTNFTELRNKDVSHTNATIEELKLKHAATATELNDVIAKVESCSMSREI